MATLEEIVVQLTAESSQLRAELNASAKATQNATQKMEDAVKQFTENSSKKVSFFESSMASMTGFLGSQAVIGVFNSLKSVVGFFVDELKEAGQEAIVEEQALVRLGNALKISGQFTNDAIKDLEDYSSEMEAVAQVSQDAIIANLSLLSSLTKLNSEGLKGAESAAIDLSAALGKDLSTTTEMVAKAINGNDMAFKKMGINLDLTKDKTQNLIVVTDAIQKQFGGSAAARINTFGGALFVLKDAWGDMFKEISKSITGNKVIIDFMNNLSKIFNGFSEGIAKNGDQVRNGIGQALIDIIGTIQSLIQGFSLFFKSASLGFSVLENGITRVASSITYLTGVATLNKELMTTAQQEVAKSTEGLKKAWASLSEDGFLDKAAEQLGTLKDSAQKAYDEMNTKGSENIKNKADQKKATEELTAAEQARLEVFAAYGKGLADQNGAIDSLFKFQQEQLKLNYDNQLISNDEFYAAKLASLQDQLATENEAIDAAREANKLIGDEYDAAKIEQAKRTSLELQKLEADRVKAETALRTQQLQNASSFFGSIVELARATNSDLGGIAKAAAMAQATMDGIVAVQKAWAQGGFFGGAMAAVVAATTAANVAKIAGVTGLKSGIDSVPGTGTQDSFPAMLAPGERVVPSKTNQDLTDFLSQGADNGPKVVINLNIGTLLGTDARELGDVLIETINNRIESGGMRLLV